jgi:tartrate dehydratase alpha subunit/fumarate hydratase class I-like protein
MYRILGIIVVFLLLALSTAAQTAQPTQTTAPDGHEQELRDMCARIERLEKLVERLQKEKESNIGDKSPPEIFFLLVKYDDVRAVLDAEGTGSEA